MSISENFKTYQETLIDILGEDVVNNLFVSLGGEAKISKAVFGSTVDSGVAYDGSMIACSIAIGNYAKKINELFPPSKRADEESIVKVALLSHIAKVLMFSENDNSWEKTNRGIIYKFENLDGALSCGERSILLAMNAGVKFTPEEYEAMRIMDKSGDDDNYTKYFSSTLSTIIRQANEIITLIKHIKK